jgi:hypothetical protein
MKMSCTMCGNLTEKKVNKKYCGGCIKVRKQTQDHDRWLRLPPEERSRRNAEKYRRNRQFNAAWHTWNAEHAREWRAANQEHVKEYDRKRLEKRRERRNQPDDQR